MPKKKKSNMTDTTLCLPQNQTACKNSGLTGVFALSIVHHT